jgi:hypothetical protein
LLRRMSSYYDSEEVDIWGMNVFEDLRVWWNKTERVWKHKNWFENDQVWLSLIVIVVVLNGLCDWLLVWFWILLWHGFIWLLLWKEWEWRTSTIVDELKNKYILKTEWINCKNHQILFWNVKYITKNVL